MSADPNLNDFHQRLARIGAAQAGADKGAKVSRKAPSRVGRLVVRVAKLLGVAVVLGLGLKAGIRQDLGAERYQARLEAMAVGGGMDRLAAWLMQTDPVTLWIAAGLDSLGQQPHVQ